MKKSFLTMFVFLSLTMAASASANVLCTDTNGYTQVFPGSTPSDCPGMIFSGVVSDQTKPGFVTPSNPVIQPAATPAAPAASTPCPGGQPQQTVTVNGQQVQAGCNLGYTPLEPIPGVNTANMDFPTLVGNIYKIAIIIGALFSVLMLTVSGIRYMLSEIVTEKSKAIQRIRACIYGLVLIAASWLILNTINPQLVTFNLTPQSAATTVPASTNAGATASPTNVAGSGGSGTSGTPPTQITITPLSVGQSTNIYDGTEAFNTLMNYQAQCRGALNPTGTGSDSQGNYTTYACQ